MSNNYLIREYWSDDTVTEYVSRQINADVALKYAKERYKCIKHVLGHEGPVRFECVGSNTSDNNRHWHPAIAMSSLIAKVYLISEIEEHSTHTTKRVMLDKVAKSNYN
jgi:hypothetical protein